jgi:hypothetical protein
MKTKKRIGIAVEMRHYSNKKDVAASNDTTVNILEDDSLEINDNNNNNNNNRTKLSSTFILILCFFGVILYSTNSILFIWAKGDESHFHFMLSSVVLLSEILRVIVCLSLILYNSELHYLCISGKFCNFNFFFYAFPAIMYAINDEIAFNCLEYMDSATFQTLSTLKIIGTAISCRLFLKKYLTDRQWFALVILTFGSIFAASASHEDLQEGHTSIRTKARYHYSKISNEVVLDDDFIVDGVEIGLTQQEKKNILTNDSVDAAIKDHRFFVTSRGLFLIVIYCILSSITAAYGEWILKRNKYSNRKNMGKDNSLGIKYLKISLWGVAFSSIHCMIDIWKHRAIHPKEAFLLSGFNNWTYILVINQCLLGVVLSAIIKELGAVVKLFILSISMLLSMFFAIFSLRLLPDLNFCLAVIAIIVAFYIYADNNASMMFSSGIELNGNNNNNSVLSPHSKMESPNKNKKRNKKINGPTFNKKQVALISLSIIFTFFYYVNNLSSLKASMVKEDFTKLTINMTEEGQIDDSTTKLLKRNKETTKGEEVEVEHLKNGGHAIHKIVVKKRL